MPRPIRVVAAAAQQRHSGSKERRRVVLARGDGDMVAHPHVGEPEFLGVHRGAAMASGPPRAVLREGGCRPSRVGRSASASICTVRNLRGLCALPGQDVAHRAVVGEQGETCSGAPWRRPGRPLRPHCGPPSPAGSSSGNVVVERDLSPDVGRDRSGTQAGHPDPPRDAGRARAPPTCRPRLDFVAEYGKSPNAVPPPTRLSTRCLLRAQAFLLEEQRQGTRARLRTIYRTGSACP